MTRIIDVEVIDVRFPTSATGVGSDAVHVDGDYSAAYVVVRTDSALCGYGLTFTIGRGNELCVHAATIIGRVLVGLEVEKIRDGGMGDVYRAVTGDSQLRWLGPEKGVIHLAAAAILNTVWDLVARAEGVPLWQLLCQMPPAELVAACDFSYLADVLTEAEAISMLTTGRADMDKRLATLERDGYPAYTTSPGWLGYDDDTLRRLCGEAIAHGWQHVKVKVGSTDPENDVRRCAIARDVLGSDRHLMIDANQVWDVPTAIERVRLLARFDPLWIEEPTSPDDLLGHAAIRKAVVPVGVASGEHVHNRVMFKQFLQAGALDYCQIDSCRLASVNEIVPVLLMCAKFGVPVCPHAGGVGLCQYVQHLSIFDYLCVSRSLDGRITEYVEHLKEHFVNPVQERNAAYVVPREAGYSIEMLSSSVDTFRFPDGAHWDASSAGQSESTGTAR